MHAYEYNYNINKFNLTIAECRENLNCYKTDTFLNVTCTISNYDIDQKKNTDIKKIIVYKHRTNAYKDWRQLHWLHHTLNVQMWFHFLLNSEN